MNHFLRYFIALINPLIQVNQNRNKDIIKNGQKAKVLLVINQTITATMKKITLVTISFI
jgi:hypothetical protein